METAFDSGAVAGGKVRLMFTRDISEKIFGGRRSESWIRRTVAPTKKLRLGHSTVAWREADVHEWLASRGMATNA